jgi:hypothetical protein
MRSASVLLASLTALPALAFVSPEHKEIGDTGFAAAVADLQRQAHADPLAGLAGVTAAPGGLVSIYAGYGANQATELGRFSFGDLVAIYGDMRATVEELNDAASKPDVAGMKAVAATGDYQHNKPERERALEIAYTNETHFSAKALEAYVQWHDVALRTAATDRSRAWKALHYEALALHSLTDIFAVGHMLVDRERTMSLLEAARAVDAKAHEELHKGIRAFLHGEWDAFRARDERWKAKVLYGFFANVFHNGFNHWGADVTNLNGDTWRAFGDHQYRVQKGGTEVTAGQRAVLKTAVSTSVLQVLRLLRGLPPPLPGLRFAALRYVPVHHRNAATSVEPSAEKLSVVKAALKQNFALLRDGGIDPALLQKRPVPAGDVAYLDALKKHCDKACAK